MTKSIGILTAGGDSPGLNAAIRGVGKAAINVYGWNVIGFQNGFRGLLENRFITLDSMALAGILTQGGTILGTSRDKPDKMLVGGKVMDMTDAMVETYQKNQLDALICLGGGGTAKNAHKLSKKGLNVICLPKTIDNDIEGTDVSFGFDTACGIATEAIDRLHSTAHSHHRIIVVETMGHNTGWLALAAGTGGGADVILIPEIPYDIEAVAEAIRARSRKGRHFSIVAVSEGAMSRETANRLSRAERKVEKARSEAARRRAEAEVAAIEAERVGNTSRLTRELEERTGLESRVTILGYVQRGGAPSAADRLLATRIGTAAVDYIERGEFGIMVAARGETTVGVPLKEVVGRRKLVPLDHEWVTSARRVGVCLGDVPPL
ncbi:MAG: 6-phosphofructokinase [Thermoflexales bacterium]|nr:6-phosphofructokinase [Thermoflexales bacterium]